MPKNIVGKLITFRGLVYAPVNEQGVVFLFGKIAHDLGMYIELIRVGYPDCIAKRYIGKDKWEDVRIEFEFKSSQFDHDPNGVDMIVCWEHDWDKCPSNIEVLELREIIQGLENTPIESPDKSSATSEYNLRYHFNKGSKETISIFEKLDERIKGIDSSIYSKPAKYRIYYYSPKRIFAGVKFLKQGLNIHFFTDGKKMKGVESFKGEYGFKWGRMYVNSKKDLALVYKNLKNSFELINQCIKENRKTGWYAEID